MKKFLENTVLEQSVKWEKKWYFEQVGHWEPIERKKPPCGGEVHNCVTNFLACLGEYLLDGEISLTGLRERECLTLTKV